VAIGDGVVQGALKLILEPIFEADFQSGSYGYRPKRTAHQAVMYEHNLGDGEVLTLFLTICACGYRVIEGDAARYASA